MADAGGGFELLGASSDETRLLLHRGCGYSIPIPGHPRLDNAIVTLADETMELAFRLDEMPSGAAPSALASALALAFSTNHAAGSRKVRLIRGNELAAGADAGAGCTYTLGDNERMMEHLAVTIRKREGGLWVLYQTIRFTLQNVNLVQWANFRTAIVDKQHWDPASPRTTAPTLWPAASDFAAPSVKLALTEAAWAESRAKAADMGPLTDVEAGELTEQLLQVSNSDDPPTLEVHPYILEQTCRQLAMRGPPRAIEAMLRNTKQIKTTHDLRAWCWQCIWAMRNRTGLPSPQP